MTKLDSNAAWQEAVRLVAANRDVLFAVAGVFILLPSLALAILMGEPPVEPGMKPQEMQAAMFGFYAGNWLLILVASLVQFTGVLSLLTLMRDRSRPTVGQAIVSGASGVPSYIGATLLFWVVTGLAGGIAMTLLALISPVLAVVMLIVLIGFAIFAGVRLILLAPVIAVEGIRNPVAALVRAWQLTAANFWRILGFILLVAILFIIVMAIVMLIVGIILGIASSGETQRVLAAVVSSALGSAASVYFIAITAAIHRQLGGMPSSDVAATFD